MIDGGSHGISSKRCHVSKEMQVRLLYGSTTKNDQYPFA